MIYKDRIFGTVKITEPVILEILKTKTFQRLKGVDQAGYFTPFFPRAAFSRYGHSLGVYLLLKKYNAHLPEQVAGLIHDVSHSAFSHCIDYILSSKSQKHHDHQDNIHENYVKNSGISAILLKHKFDLEYILDDKNFPLKENLLPDICADRIEYSLRVANVYDGLPSKKVKFFLKNLTVINNQWVFKNFEAAYQFARLFSRLNTKYMSGIESAVMFRTVGDYLKYSLNKKYISKSDLYTTDREVLNKVSKNLKRDAHLRLLFDRMNNKIGYKNDPQDYDTQVFCKSRIIDPLCVYKGKIKRVSQVDYSWKKVLAAQSKPKEYFLKFAR